MATLVYASPTDYTTWTGAAAPSNITQILRSASLAVREATELFYYQVDSTGLPTDAAIKQAFNDATCCQAAALVAAGYDPTTGGTVTASVEQSSSIGTAHITYSNTDAQNAAEAKARLITGLTPDAQRILKDAGVMRAAPWLVG